MGHGVVQHPVVCGGYRQGDPLQQIRDEGLPQQLRPGQLLQLGDKAGGAHQHPGAVVQQHPGLPGRHRTAAHHQDRFVIQVNEEGKADHTPGSSQS